jgi:rhodanese-related sulfurtransferase
MRINPTGLLAALLLAISGSVVLADAGQMSSVTPKEATALRAEKQAVIVDVREDGEWQDQHIAGAVHIPLSQLNTRLAELDKYKHSPIITQCRSGKRSAQAQTALKAAGFTQVYNMDGGILAWQQQGLATE